MGRVSLDIDVGLADLARQNASVVDRGSTASHTWCAGIAVAADDGWRYQSREHPVGHGAVVMPGKP